MNHVGTLTASDPADWLVDTRQLDLSHPKLRITAHKLTQAKQTLAARAGAIHDFVRRLPFAASADSHTLSASEVLSRGSGDCHSKGVLFTALCRAAGLPARLLFVQVRARFLAGILDGGPEALPHAVGQVWVDGHWVSTDSYVVDPLLFVRAKSLLRERGLDCGWGVVDDASGYWDGRHSCLHQFRRGDVLARYGAFHDPQHFHAASGERPGWAGQLKYAVAAHLVNRRVRAVRAHG
jgi:transglutaminase-like putative cysteine protease